MAETTDSISREEVYDIVRDSIGLPNPTVNPPGDVQMPTVEYLRKKQAEQAQYQVAGLLAPPAFEPINTIPGFEKEHKEYQLNHCVEVLQEANRICKDEILMKEIRLFIRQKRDEAATLLDEIG